MDIKQFIEKLAEIGAGMLSVAKSIKDGDMDTAVDQLTKTAE